MGFCDGSLRRSPQMSGNGVQNQAFGVSEAVRRKGLRPRRKGSQELGFRLYHFYQSLPLAKTPKEVDESDEALSVQSGTCVFTTRKRIRREARRRLGPCHRYEVAEATKQECVGLLCTLVLWGICCNEEHSFGRDFDNSYYNYTYFHPPLFPLALRHATTKTTRNLEPREVSLQCIVWQELLACLLADMKQRWDGKLGNRLVMNEATGAFMKPSLTLSSLLPSFGVTPL
jgi:hypothetical protein